MPKSNEFHDRTVEVTARTTGEKQIATLVSCGDCGGEEFLIYFIADDVLAEPHMHIQCLVCGNCLCQPAYKPINTKP